MPKSERATGMSASRQRNASMQDVADRAGVAVSSVSRVIRGHEDVSSVMRNRVLDAVAALGYEPNLLAQSLRTGATMTVGFVVGDISNPLMSEIALGAEQALNGVGYNMLLTNSGNDRAVDAQHIRLLRQRRVDGLLLSLADDTASAHEDALANLDVPYVLIDRDVHDAAGSVVQSAHDLGMQEAMEHLVRLGHTRIALVGGPTHVRPSRERANALRRFGRSSGVAVMVRSGPFSAEHGESATKDLLAISDSPTAIICGGNQILVGVLRALRGQGARIPADMSLITCDELPLAEFLNPPLATIVRDPAAMGAAGADLLLAMLAGDPPARRLLPTEYKPAPSCGPPRLKDFRRP